MSKHHLELDRPYKQDDPLDMDDARRAAHRMAQIRREREADYRTAIEDRAAKEAEYRKNLSLAIVRLRGEGVASSAAPEAARGDDTVKQSLIDFRIAEGMVDAHKQRLQGVEGERSMLKSLIDYSAKVGAALRGVGG